MNTNLSTKPIPTRFREREMAFLHLLHNKTGLSISELVRRSVRLLSREMQRPNAERMILSLVA